MDTIQPLPTFSSTLAWPKPIDPEMAQFEAMERYQKMEAAFTKGVEEGDETMIALMEQVHRSLEEPGQEGINQKIEEISQHNSDRIHFLSQWMEIVKSARIPHIPIEIGPLITADDLEQTHEALQERRPEHLPQSVLETILPWIQAQQERGWMWRYEFCASEVIKMVLGTIRPPNYLDMEKVRVPFSTDDRVLHCLWDTGRKDSNLLARPWERATFEKGFPVEFRVFRLKDGWSACNYYVQRPLDQKWEGPIKEAIELAKKLEEHAKATNVFIPEEYTTDWIVSHTGEIKFLEAGPGFTPTGGAHPCCFAPEAFAAGRILLATEEGGLTWCPPDVQEAVDRIKAGEHPLAVAEATQQHPQEILAHASIQGYQPAQIILEQIRKSRFVAMMEEMRQAAAEQLAAGPENLPNNVENDDLPPWDTTGDETKPKGSEG